MQTLHITLTTWNVGGASAPSGGVPVDARNLLRSLSSQDDIAVVGLQEVQRPGRGWKAALRAAIDTDWRVRAGCRYLGMRIIILVRERAFKRVLALRTMRVGSGVADLFPNKGAVAVDLRLDNNTTVCFVVAHLAAQEGNLREREADWKNIVRRLQTSESLGAEGANVPLFMRYDHVFIMGDLNYRLVPSVGTTLAERVKWVGDHVHAENWDALTAVDELAAERSTGNVFANFNEGRLDFPPTFKYDPCTADSLMYNTSRVPSYCDRILWHSLPSRSSMVHQVEYTAVHDVTSSDHRPARASFILETPPAVPKLPVAASTGIRAVLEFKFVRFTRYKDDMNRNRRKNERKFRPSRRAEAMLSTCDNDPLQASSPSSSSQASHVNAQSSTLRRHRRGNNSLDIEERYINGENDDELNDEDDASLSSTSSTTTSTDTPGNRTDLLDDFECFGMDGDPLTGAFDATEQVSPQVNSLKLVYTEDSVRFSPNDHGPLRDTVRQMRDIEETLPVLRLNDVGSSSQKVTPRESPLQTSGTKPPHSTTVNNSGSASDTRSQGVKLHQDGTVLGELSRNIKVSELFAEGEQTRKLLTTPGVPMQHSSSASEEVEHLERIKAIRSKSGPEHSGASELANEFRESSYRPVRREKLLPTNGGDSIPQDAKERQHRKRQKTTNVSLMDVHGASVFLDPNKVYSMEIPKSHNGLQECSDECLPAIPLRVVRDIQDFRFEHVLISFWRAKSRMGLCGVLPLSMLLEKPSETYSFELKLTKYGRVAGLLEASVQLVVSTSCLWLDSLGRVVRAKYGKPSKTYQGPLAIRQKARRGGRFTSQAAKTAQSARTATKMVLQKLDSLGSDRA